MGHQGAVGVSTQIYLLEFAPYWVQILRHWGLGRLTFLKPCGKGKRPDPLRRQWTASEGGKNKKVCRNCAEEGVDRHSRALWVGNINWYSFWQYLLKQKLPVPSMQHLQFWKSRSGSKDVILLLKTHYGREPKFPWIGDENSCWSIIQLIKRKRQVPWNSQGRWYLPHRVLKMKWVNVTCIAQCLACSKLSMNAG